MTKHRKFMIITIMAIGIISNADRVWGQNKLVAKLLTVTDNDAEKEYLAQILKQNFSFLTTPATTKYMMDAQSWFRRCVGIPGKENKFLITYISGFPVFKNIHPQTGRELCFSTDEGLFIISVYGKIIGEIKPPIHSTYESVRFMELDCTEVTSNLLEVVYKFQDMSNPSKSIILIFKYIDDEYQIVFQKSFHESMYMKGIMHALEEQINLTPYNYSELLIRTNDEGTYEYFRFIKGKYTKIDFQE